MLSDQESIAVEEVLTLLYCCPSFQDFRKPVEILYPALWDQYQKAIATPVDLGNLLLKSKRGLLKINEMREHMQLVSKNCIKFNGNASIMVNISNHYTSYATALFEEILNLPFKDPSQTFKTRRIAQRVDRYEFVKSEPLNNRELKRLRDILHDLTPPEPLKPTMQKVIGTVSHILFENAEVTEDSCGNLLGILQPLVEVCTNDCEPSAVCRDIAIVPANCQAHRDFLTFLKLLDDAVGVLSAMIQERLLRGNTYSTRWLRPYKTVVWALPPKDGKGRAPWWPAFIVASASKLYPMHPEACQINLARIPDDIKTQLYKLRPRGNQHTSAVPATSVSENGEAGNGADGNNTTITPDGSALGEVKPTSGSKKSRSTPVALTDFVVPEGYLLIEFFGSHDFGWIKADLCGPFKVTESADGELVYTPPPAPSPSSSNSSSGGGGTFGATTHAVKTCSPEILKEAVNAALYLEDLVLTAGEAIPEDFDLAVPTMSELEESLVVNESYQSLTMLSNRPHATAAPPANGKAGTTNESVKHSHSGAASKRKSSPVDKTTEGESRKRSKTGGTATAASASTNGHSVGHVDTSGYSVTNYPGVGSVVSHSSVTAEELSRCMVNNTLKMSKCSLPHRKGVLLSSLTSATATDGESADLSATHHTGTSSSSSGNNKKRFFKENAVHRCKIISAWMEKLRPLSFSHYSVTKQNEATLAIAVKNNASLVGGSVPPSAATVAPGDSPMEVNGAKTVTTTADDNDAEEVGYWQEEGKKKEPEEEGITSVLARIRAAAATEKHHEKRKYVFKHNNKAAGAASAATAEKSIEIGKFRKRDEEGGGAVGGGGGGPKRVYTGTHLTSSGTNCFLLETGSSRHFQGEGSVYTRRVKWDSDVFFLESKSLAVRKAILKEELAYIAKAYKNIQEIASQRAQDATLRRSALPQDSDSNDDSQGSSDEGSEDGEDEDEEGSSAEEDDGPVTHIQQAIKAQLQNAVSPIKNLPGKVGLIAQLERQKQQQLASKAPVSIKNMLPI